MIKVISFIRDFFRKYPGLTIASTLINVATSLFGVLSLFCLSPIIDIFLHPDMKNLSSMTIKVTAVLHILGLPVSLMYLVFALMLFVVVGSGLQVLGYQFSVRISFIVMRDVITGAFKDFFGARWSFFSSSEQGTLYNTFNREMTSLANGFSAMGSMFASAIQLVILLVVPFYISWEVTLTCFLFGIVVSIASLFFSRMAYNIGKRSVETANKLSSFIFENISFAKLVLGYGNQKKVVQDAGRTCDVHQAYGMRLLVLNYAIPIAYRPLAVAVVGIVLVSSQWFSVPLSEAAVLLLALFQVTISLGNIIGQKNLISGIIPSSEQIQALRTRAIQMRQPSGNILFTDFSKEVRIKKLSFGYPAHPLILSNIDLVIPKGKMVAFVGGSGAGKSTLIDILFGFHTPNQGEVLVDGRSLFDYDIFSYREKLGYVPQESALFNMSIRDNLLWVDPQATQDEIEEACRLAHAQEFIMRFPLKYDTVVGDRGVRLSGGQVQRLALARAFLRKPQILILDEATSSLDSYSETLIQESVEAMAKKITVVVVAHRLSTIRHADIIYVLSHGKIVEQGTYDELMRKGVVFPSMVKLQEL